MSTITLYKHCKIEDERNLVVDNISTYLSTLTKDTFNDMQYIKNEIEAEIKVILPQETISLNNTLDYNYCMVQNDVYGSVYYYFIKNIVWVSKNAIRLVLKLDTLNTFNGKFTFDKQTKILRQHKDRFIKNPSYTIRIDAKRDDFGTPITPGTYPYVFEYEEEIETFTDRTVSATAEVYGSPLLIAPSINQTTIVGNILKVHLEWALNPTLWKGARIEVVYSASTSVTRNIDILNEGINPTLYKNEERYLNNEKYSTNENWYLIYKGDGQESFVHTYLTKDEQFTLLVEPGTPSKTILPTDLTANTYYYIDFATQTVDNPRGDGTGEKNLVTITDGNGTNIGTATVTGRKTVIEGVVFNTAEALCYYLSGSKIVVFKQIYIKQNNGELGGWSFVGFETLATNLDSISLNSTKNYLIYEKASITKPRTDIRNGSATAVTVTPTTATINGLNQLNRYDTAEKYIKIIELPYAPIDITYDSDNDMYIVNSPNTSVANSLIKINGSIKSSMNLVGGDNILYKAIEKVDIHPTYFDTRIDAYESKLFNSEFYMPKIVYDNFAIDFKLEYVSKTASIDSTKWNVGYRVSQALGSSMLFTFNDYVCTVYNEDYNSILYINRNNQVALYDSAYIDYIKTAYNYDVKQNRFAITQNGLQTIMDTIEGAKYGGWAGAVAGAVKGIASTITTAYQTQNAMEQKMYQLSLQNTNIRDCDDLDVFNEYSNNKLKLVIYKPSEKQLTNIKDMFYYCGYNENVMGVPNTNSRIWFNFLQCIPVFKITSTSAFMNNDIKNDLIQRYNEGVTYLHNTNGTYDFEQIKENYETWLFN